MTNYKNRKNNCLGSEINQMNSHANTGELRQKSLQASVLSDHDPISYTNDYEEPQQRSKRTIYHAAQQFDDKQQRSYLQSPEDWISAGMGDRTPPFYAIPTCLADMRPPTRLTKTACKLMHLVFATACWSGSSSVKLKIASIGKFTSDGQYNAERIVDTIHKLDTPEFTFHATGMTNNTQPKKTKLFSKIRAQKGSRHAFLELDKWIFFELKKFKQLYSFISLSSISKISSAPALFLFPASICRLQSRSAKNKVQMMSSLSVINPDDNPEAPAPLDLAHGFPSNAYEIAAWTGSKSSAASSIMRNLERAADSLERDLGANSPLKLEIFGQFIDDDDKPVNDVVKVENGKLKKFKVFSYLFKTPEQPFEYTCHARLYDRKFDLKAPEYLFISSNLFSSTVKKMGFDPAEPGVSDMIHSEWIRYLRTHQSSIFDRSIGSHYIVFSNEIIANFRMTGELFEITEVEANELKEFWARLTQKHLVTASLKTTKRVPKPVQKAVLEDIAEVTVTPMPTAPESTVKAPSALDALITEDEVEEDWFPADIGRGRVVLPGETYMQACNRDELHAFMNGEEPKKFKPGQHFTVPDFPGFVVDDQGQPKTVGEYENICETYPGHFPELMTAPKQILDAASLSIEDIPENTSFSPRVISKPGMRSRFAHKIGGNSHDLPGTLFKISHTIFDAFRVPGFPDVLIRIEKDTENDGWFQFQIFPDLFLKNGEQEASDFPFRELKMSNADAKSKFLKKLDRIQKSKTA
jgi:hypothetical protein